MQSDKAQNDVGNGTGFVPEAGKTVFKTTATDAITFSNDPLTSQEYMKSGLVSVLGEALYTGLYDIASKGKSPLGFKNMLASLFEDVSKFSRDGRVIDINPQAANRLATSQRVGTIDIFSNVYDYPFVLVSINDVPLHASYLVSKKDNEEIERGKLSFTVNMTAVKKNDTLIVGTQKSLPKEFDVNQEKYDKIVSNVKPIIKIAESGILFGQIGRILPNPSEEMVARTVKISKDPYNIGRQPYCLKQRLVSTPPELKKMRAFRTNVGNMAKEYRSCFARINNGISTVSKWLLAVAASNNLSTNLKSIGTSPDDNWQGILAYNQIPMLKGDILDSKTHDSEGYLQKYKPALFGVNDDDEIAPAYTESAYMSTPYTTSRTLDARFNVKDIESFFAQTQYNNEVKVEKDKGPRILLSDVFLYESKPKDSKIDAVYFLFNLQLKLYAKYAKFLETGLYDIVIVKLKPTAQFKEDTKQYFQFGFSYLNRYFADKFILIFPGSRLHNGELIAAIANTQDALDELKASTPHVADLEKNFSFGVQKINEAYVKSMAAGMRYRMYFANIIRNSLLSIGCFSLYQKPEDSVLFFLDKVSIFMVHKPYKESSNTSVSNMIDSDGTYELFNGINADEESVEGDN